MPADYVPRSDSDFLVWARNLNTNLGVLPTGSVSTADVTSVGAVVETFSGSMDSLVANQHQARMCRSSKDSARAAAEQTLRAVIRRIQAAPGITDDMRIALGLTVADGTPSAAGVPDGSPMLKVDTSERFKHTIAFFQTTPDGQGQRAKPVGAKGCAIYRKIGAPPTVVQGAPTDMEFLALDTASPYVVQYGTAEAGKMVYYMSQWMGGPHGDEPGPWSETVEATVVG